MSHFSQHTTTVFDHKNRRFEKLRVSLTNDCNFSCTYCVGDIIKDKSHPMGTAHQIMNSPRPKQGKKLNADEFLTIISQINSVSPLKQIRFTGGEPLLHKDLFELIEGVKKMGISEVGLTTNAFYLDRDIEALKAAELTSINISLDAMDDATLRRMSGVPNASKVLKNIQLGVKAGLPIKLNSVIMNGLNQHQILPLLDFSKSLNITIRFIEFMKMGSYYQQHENFTFTENKILQVISSKYLYSKQLRDKSSTANYWKLEDGSSFGIIANDSSPFCADCNRLRLDSYGKIYGCLSNPNGIAVVANELSPSKTEAILHRALLQKQEHHFGGSTIEMQHIGG